MPTYDNPVLPGDHPDQNIFIEGKDFYLLGSTFNMTPNVEIYHSTDLIHWERFSRVVDPTWSGLASSIAGGGTWGGFIVKIPGGYRAYFAVRFSQYFAHAASLAGPWDAPVQVNSFGYSPNGGTTVFQKGNGYDDSVFVDDDGTTYLVEKTGQCKWSGISGDSNFGVNQLIRIDPDTGMLDSQKVIDLSFVNWNSAHGGCGDPTNDAAHAITMNWAEGPTMAKRNGYYYYFAATHTGCGGREYVWRSQTLSSNPSDWTPLGPFLVGGSPFTGAQHSTAPFQIADGTWWVFSHSYDCSGGWTGLARQGLLSRVTWTDDPAGGGIPSASGDWTTPAAVPNLPPSGIPFLLPFSDEFDATTLRTGWTFMGFMPPARYSTTDRPGWLRIKPLAGQTTHVVQKDALHANAMVARMEFTPAAAGDGAGLRLGNALPAEQVSQMGSWSKPASIELSLARVMTTNGDQVRFGLGTFSQSALPTPTSAYSGAAAPAGSVVWLKIVRAAHQATGWFSSDGLGWTQVGTSLDISALDDNPSLGNTWVSNQAGIFASNKSADFDFFTYRDGFTDIPAVKPDQHSGATAVTSSAKGTVLSFKNGDWALYGSVDLGSGGLQSQGIELTMASAGEGAEVEVWTDPLAGGKRIATCTVAGAGGWEAWQTASCPLAATGMHEVYLRVVGGAGELLRLAKLRFVPK
jgi:beta-xylosidase